MSASTLISVEEYLSTTYEPDREYVDGELVERNLGTYSHSRLQLVLASLFHQAEARTGIHVVVEMRTRVNQSRYRIPDIAIYGRKPEGEVPSEPPLAAIEILSPDDRMHAVIAKLAEYHAWGVSHVWLADPDDRKFFIYGANGLHEVTAFELAEHAIRLDLDTVFGAAQ